MKDHGPCGGVVTYRARHNVSLLHDLDDTIVDVGGAKLVLEAGLGGGIQVSLGTLPVAGETYQHTSWQEE